jgi:hydroxymethylglutaryl-CoA lyase
MEDCVTIVEVSPRDGLPVLLGGADTATKVMYINNLAQTGLKKIDCVAFTHPRLIQENADAEQVIEGIDKKPGVTYIGVVPNEIGCRRALFTKIDEILTIVSVSEVFMKINSGKSLKEYLQKIFPAVFNAAIKGGKTIRSYILTAFGCPFTGKISIEDVVLIVQKMIHLGTNEIVLVDSAGMANPRQVKELLKTIFDLNLNINLAVHFHNTRGAAIANCVAAYEAGVRIFDTSLAGMSGTPYGHEELVFGCWNVPTEDLVHLFEEMGIKTGIDLDRLLECVKLAEQIAKKPLPGHILRANSILRLTKEPDSMIKLNSLFIC